MPRKSVDYWLQAYVSYLQQKETKERNKKLKYLQAPTSDPVRYHQSNGTQLIPTQPSHSSAPGCDPSLHPGFFGSECVSVGGLSGHRHSPGF